MWIFEIVSSILGDWNYGDSCYTRLVMDVPNLLAGFIIFMASFTQSYSGIKRNVMKLRASKISTEEKSEMTKDISLSHSTAL